jgi:transposase
MLSESIDGILGVDTHRDTLAAAVVTAVGPTLASTEATADADGYQRLLHFARRHLPNQRCWAVEGTSSYGAGLTEFLIGQGERVVEVCRPKRPPRRGGRKSDALDAVRAAREVLSSDHLIEPRSRGQREALRVLMTTRAGAVAARTAAINHLKALIVSDQKTCVRNCAGAPAMPRSPTAHGCVTAPPETCSTAPSSGLCGPPPNAPKRSEQKLMTSNARSPASSPTFSPSWSNCPESGRSPLLRSSSAGHTTAGSAPKPAFATLAGAAPIPASSGLTNRRRLNRGGDRQLNRALHTIVLTRSRTDPATRAYITRRLAEGKTPKGHQAMPQEDHRPPAIPRPPATPPSKRTSPPHH